MSGQITHLQHDMLKILSPIMPEMDFNYQILAEFDVVLVLGEYRIPAHRFVLAAASDYFRGLLLGDFVEAGQRDVNIEDVDIEAFSFLMKQIYGETVDLSILTLEVLLDALEYSRRFNLCAVEDSLVKWLETQVNPENVLQIFAMAMLLELDTLAELCLRQVEKSADTIYHSRDFLELSEPLLMKILARKRNIGEIEAIQAVSKWFKRNRATPKEEISACFDLSEMTADQIIHIVYRTKVFSGDHLMNVLRAKGITGVQAVSGHNMDYLTSTERYCEGDKVAMYNISRSSLEIDLGEVFVVNHIEMNIMYGAGYLIELSIDEHTWTPVLNYERFICFGIQTIYFRSTPAKFVKITKNRSLSVNSFKITYAPKVPKMIDTIICPPKNIITPGKARVWSLMGYKELPLIQKFEDHGVNTRFTAGNIEVKFSQPYVINTVCLRLWDFDGRKQTFKVANYADEILHRAEMVEGWQLVKFPTTTMRGFKIVGLSSMPLCLAYIEAFFVE